MRNRERIAWGVVGLLVTTILLGGNGYQATNYQNGDVNGDGAIDVSDAVYLLSYLFEGGPEPVTIRGLVRATGQTECWDASGNPTPCDNSALPGQDGLYQLGAEAAGRFLVNGDGTVTDQLTGLMWRTDILQVGDWPTSLQFCEGLSFAGFDDWRMPNESELLSITRPVPPGEIWAIDTSVFQAAFSGIGGSLFAWSSTTGAPGSPNPIRCVGITTSFGALTFQPTGLGPSSTVLVLPVRGPID